MKLIFKMYLHSCWLKRASKRHSFPNKRMEGEELDGSKDQREEKIRKEGPQQTSDDPQQTSDDPQQIQQIQQAATEDGPQKVQKVVMEMIENVIAKEENIIAKDDDDDEFGDFNQEPINNQDDFGDFNQEPIHNDDDDFGDFNQQVPSPVQQVPSPLQQVPSPVQQAHIVSIESNQQEEEFLDSLPKPVHCRIKHKCNVY